MINSKAYLNRIHYQDTVTPTLAVLQALQRQHLLHIPFENWFIHDRLAITLDTPSLFRKIVEQQRGGFCYELNGLFYVLLSELGFSARLVSARVYSSSNDRFGAEFDHMAIVVTLNGQDYLVDVGFGEFALHPLAVTPDTVQHDKRGDFLLRQEEKDFIVYKQNDKNKKSEFKPEYRLSLTARKIEDFAERCQYHQTSPQSHFTQKRLLSLATEDGRITLSGNNLTVRKGNQITETVLSDNVDSIIEQYFSPFPTTQ